LGVTNAIAVSNDDGNVFIIREVSEAVDVLDPSGTSIAQPFVGSPFFPNKVAVSSDGDTFFVVDGLALASVPPVWKKFTSDGASPPTYTEDPTWDPNVPSGIVNGMAIDPIAGDLVVSGSGGVIYRYDSDSGALLSSFDGSTNPRGPFGVASSIAVAPNGDVYVVVGPDRVDHMGADGSWKGELKVPKAEGATPPRGIAVNPQNGDVAVELRQGDEWVIKLYTSANDLKDTVRVPSPLAGENAGLAFAPDGGKLYIGTTNGSAHVFAQGTRPGVDPPSASDITTTGAHLTATVATGGELTDARIEYCNPSDPCDKYLGSEGSSPWEVVSEETALSDPVEEVSGDLSGLESNTEYLLRTTAVNEAGQVEGISATGSFKTALAPPDVQTGEARAVTDTFAEVAGTIGTFGGQTTYHFEYGPTTSYGSSAPAGADGIAGNERSPRTFTETLKGLQPATIYHYRLVATNAAGTTLGEDRTFTTLGSDEVAPRRGYEMVTPPQKNGFALFSNWGFQASADGSAIVYSGAAAPSDASSSPQASRYMSRRETSGWSGSKPLDPPINPVRAITTTITQGVSADFEHTFVLSQKALAPGAVEDGANFYVNDVDTGAYHLIGTATQPGAFSQLVGPLGPRSFIAGAADFSWVVLISRYPLLPDAPQEAMYKWTSTAGLSLVSLLPGDAVPIGNTWSQEGGQTTNRLVSDDGETLAFSLKSGERGVYRRSNGETEPVSVSQATGGPAGVQPGQVDAISRDGRYVVFHSPAPLTDSATDSGPKVYQFDSSAGQLEYLGPQDGTNDGAVDVPGISGDGRTVYFNSNNQLVVWSDGQLDLVYPGAIRGASYGYPSPNGRYFAFVPGDGSVHLYDAIVGEDRCISCSPDGPGTAGRLGGLPDRNLSNRFPQVVTDDGHAYFDTTSALVGADRNATSDVYEYYKGRLTLISPGDEEFIATLADITPDGSSVYFTTAQGLVRQDTDQTYDVYVARVGGGFPEPPAPPAECSGEACRGSTAAPAAVGIGSATGRSGSPKPNRPLHCRKGTHKVRKNGKARCVKNKRHAKKRETKHNRGAGR
jgi:hypothetical protein